MPRLTTRDGDRLHYYDIGRGPTCVLLHGFGMPGFLWFPSVMPLSRRWRFIIPDLRGFGGSHTLPIRRETVFEQFADDLDDLLMGLGLDNVALAGLSMGACTALEYQARYGFGRIRAYMNIDNPPCISNRDDWQWGLFGDNPTVFRAGLESLLDALGQIDRNTAFADIPKPVRRQMWTFFSQFASHAMHSRLMHMVCQLARFEPVIRLVAPTHNWPVYLDLMHSFSRDDLDWRASIATAGDLPFEVHYGTASQVYPPAGEKVFGELVPQARFVPYKGCGHAVMFDAPRQFSRHLHAFLKRTYRG